jgi:hypothetical protein
MKCVVQTHKCDLCKDVILDYDELVIHEKKQDVLIGFVVLDKQGKPLADFDICSECLYKLVDAGSFIKKSVLLGTGVATTPFQKRQYRKRVRAGTKCETLINFVKERSPHRVTIDEITCALYPDMYNGRHSEAACRQYSYYLVAKVIKQGKIKRVSRGLYVWNRPLVKNGNGAKPAASPTTPKSKKRTVASLVYDFLEACGPHGTMQRSIIGNFPNLNPGTVDRNIYKLRDINKAKKISETHWGAITDKFVLAEDPQASLPLPPTGTVQ